MRAEERAAELSRLWAQHEREERERRQEAARDERWLAQLPRPARTACRHAAPAAVCGLLVCILARLPYF